MKKALLSTDIGSDIDDALSLQVMMNAGIPLKGIYTVNGDVAARAYIAKHQVKLAGKKIPVACGAAQPLGAPVSPYNVHVDLLIPDEYLIEQEGKIELVRLPFKEAGIIENGIEHLAEQLRKEPHTVFSIAPLTNIALLLRSHPDAAANIEHLYIMGARFPEGDLEHNFRHDTQAAQEVLASDIPITVIPGDVCGGYRMPASDGEQLKETPSGQFVYQMLHAFIGGKLVENMRQDVTFGSELIRIMQTQTPHIDSMDRDKIRQELEKHTRLQTYLINFDTESAYLEKEQFWIDFYWVCKQLREPGRYKHGAALAHVLESHLPTTVAVHDAYVPYVFLHPERITTERKTVGCTSLGETYLYEGKKHEVVTGIDYSHFAEFLKEHLK